MFRSFVSFKAKIDKESSEVCHHLVLMIHDSSLCHNDTSDTSSVSVVRIFFQVVKNQYKLSHQRRGML